MIFFLSTGGLKRTQHVFRMIKVCVLRKVVDVLAATLQRACGIKIPKLHSSITVEMFIQTQKTESAVWPSRTRCEHGGSALTRDGTCLCDPSSLGSIPEHIYTVRLVLCRQGVAWSKFHRLWIHSATLVPHDCLYTALSRTICYWKDNRRGR